MSARSLAAFAALLALACAPESKKTPGPAGPAGPPGDDGQDGHSAWFTGPGVRVEVTGLEVGAPSARVSFTLTDAAGVPLDRAGRLTAGAVETSFALGQLGPDGAYVPYTTVVQTAGAASATHGALESSGTFETVDVLAGTYRYTFAAPLGGFDPARTQTVVAVAARALDGKPAVESDTFSVVPAGGTPVARAIVDGARCADCHGKVSAHEGRFSSVAQCAVCHGGGTDPDTGRSIALDAMVHAIHRGAALPSVVAGTPLQLVGADGALHDWSTVRFPRPVQHCAACHAGDTWKTRPSDRACLSCHDTTAFIDPPPEGMVLHGGGVPPAGAACATCHGADGGVSPISVSHLHPYFDPAATRIALAILDVTSTGPGQVPTITFEVKVNGEPRNIVVAPLSTLTLTLVGPNTDYGIASQARIQGSGATGTLVAVDAGAGVFAYTPSTLMPIPANATGSWTAALEGSFTTTPRVAATAPPRAFAVTDVTPVARRVVVDQAKCNACHLEVFAHNGTRKGVQHCVTCHGPASYDDRVSRLEGSRILAESVDFRVMIHKIHAGTALTQPYVLFGLPTPSPANPVGVPIDFTTTRYPRPLSSCAACHVGETFTLPSPSTRPSVLAVMECSEQPAEDFDDYCTSPFWYEAERFTLPPATAACTSCHDAPHVAIHAALETTPDGREGCATCHGPGSTWDVAVVHRIE